MIEQKLSKRELILESAIEIFLEEGYVEASVDRIAQHSGVAKQTVYSTFKNKRNLFEAVIAILTERSSFAGFDPAWLQLPPAAFIETVSDLVLQQMYNRRFPRFLRMITKECRMFPELQNIYHETISKPWLDFVTTYFQQHAELQIGDANAAAFCLRAALASFAADANFDPSGNHYREHRAGLIDALTKVVTRKAGNPVVTNETIGAIAKVLPREEVQSIFTSDRRGMILDGALRAFLQSGFTLTSMDDVALAADVSKQTVYGYFTDKKSLFETLSDELLSFLKSEVPAPRATADLKNFAQDFLGQLSRPPFREFIRVVLGVSHKFQPTSDKYLLYLFVEYRPPLEHIFRENAQLMPIGATFAAMIFAGTLADYSILRLIYSTADYADLSSERLLDGLFDLLGLSKH